jgi:hypothetical protein
MRKQASNKKKEGTMDWLHLQRNCLLIDVNDGKIEGKTEVTDDEEER